MQKQKILVSVFILLVVALWLAACAPDANRPGKAVTLTGDPVAGKAIFDGYCKSCHGEAGQGGIANPGSDDGSVPELAPIDIDLKSVTAIDLVIEHGSTPEGLATASKMPAFGDEGSLKPQQIADVIAYIMSLNK